MIGIIIYMLFHFKLMVNNNIFTSIIRNYIPDMCWTISFFLASIVIAKNIIKKYILLNSIFVITTAFIFEVMQKANIIKGTFDYYDLCIYMISIIIATIIEIKIRRNEDEKSR